MEQTQRRSWWSALGAGALALVLASCGSSSTPVASVPPKAEDVSIAQQATATTGLTGVYYDNLDFTGKTVTQVDATINKSWGTAAPVSGIQPTTYSVRWTGQVLPAYSEAYTFSLTSSGGARLIVNGQVLVNDWTEHASKVSQGTVKLVAGQKYDIRLDYFRNTANAGAVKLEWNSSKQTKQVIPTNKTAPTGSNASVGLSLIKTELANQKVSYSINELKSAVILESDGGLVINAIKQGTLGGYYGYSSRGQLQALFDVSLDNSELKISDLKSGKSKNFGAASAFFNADGSQDDAQKRRYFIEIANFLSDGALTAASIQTSALNPQVIIDSLCQNVIKPPSGCEGGCNAAAIAYRDTVCFAAGAVEGFITVIYSNVGYDITNNLDPEYGPNNINYVAKWKAYAQCLNDKADCIVGADIVPYYSTRTRVGRSDSVILKVSNQSSKPQANAPLTGNAAITSNSPSISGGSKYLGIVAPLASTSIPITWTCVKVETLTANIVLETNANFPINLAGSVKVDCYVPTPKITAPDTITLTGIVGQTATNNFDLSNTGDTDSILNYAITSTGPSVSPSSGALASGKRDSIKVSQPCTVAGNTQSTLSIKDSVLGSAVAGKTISITLSCVADPFPYKAVFAKVTRDISEGSSTRCYGKGNDDLMFYTYWSTGHAEDVLPTNIVYPSNKIIDITIDCTLDGNALSKAGSEKYKTWIADQMQAATARLKSNYPNVDFTRYSISLDCGGGGWYPPSSDYCINYSDWAYFVIEPIH